MPDARFFKKKSSFSLKDLASFINAKIMNATGTEVIEDIGTLENGGEGEISFLSNVKYLDALKNTKVSACIINEKYISFIPDNIALLVTPNPYEAYAIIASKFYPFEKEKSSYISKNAVLPSSCKLGTNVDIAENVVLGENVEIGDNTSIASNTVICDNVIIGKNCRIASNITISYSMIGNDCIIHSGARIGQDGFGFAPSAKGITKIAQLGRVIIGDNVEIGANTCIDRGAINDTVIGDNTKIDNLVQIGHNCIIGRSCFICGQVGLAGSTIVGDGVMLGGQVGVAGHLKIGSGSMIAAQSGVSQDVEPKAVLGGYPALPIREWHKITAMLKKLISKK